MDLELTGDVGLRRPELARVPEHATHRVGGAELDLRGVLGAGDGAVPGPQPDRQVAADERAAARRRAAAPRPVRGGRSRLSVTVMSSPAVGRGRAGGRRCSPRRSRPGSTPGRSATSGRRPRRSRGSTRSSRAARKRVVPLPQRLGVVLPEGEVAATRSVVWSRVTSSITSTDGRKPPGKMYLLIQVNWPRVASIRSCGIVIAWMPTLPPGASTWSMVEKYDGQYSAPTASIISTETHRVVLPTGVLGRGPRGSRRSRCRPGRTTPAVGDPLTGQLELLGRERDRVDVGAAAGGADRELAPAGADLEHPGALADAGDVEQPLDLAHLRLRQVGRVGRGRQLRARRTRRTRRAPRSSSASGRGTAGTGRWRGRSGGRSARATGSRRAGGSGGAWPPRTPGRAAAAAGPGWPSRRPARSGSRRGRRARRCPRRRSCTPRRSRSGRRGRCGRRTPRGGGSASPARRGRAPRGDPARW